MISRCRGNWPSTWSDQVPDRAQYNRINERRSNIGTRAIKIIEAHIKSLGSENAGKDWLRWCMRKDGPLFFKVPSPLENENGEYQVSLHHDFVMIWYVHSPPLQFPEGRLLSGFIISLAAPLIPLRSGSASENGYPKGLIALIMAAVRHILIGHWIGLT